MDNLNYVLFEEFTKLNKACMTVYQMEDGISDYLAQMAGVSSAYWDSVPDWSLDFDQLKRYQTMYHSLAHSMDAFEEVLCQQEDVQWVRTFHARMMDRQDPLALLQARGYRAEDDARQRIEDSRTGQVMLPGLNPRDRYVNGPLIVWLLLGAVILTCIISLLVFSYLSQNGGIH